MSTELTKDQIAAEKIKAEMAAKVAALVFSIGVGKNAVEAEIRRFATALDLDGKETVSGTDFGHLIGLVASVACLPSNTAPEIIRAFRARFAEMWQSFPKNNSACRQSLYEKATAKTAKPIKDLADL
jgi:hypothetical protein